MIAGHSARIAKDLNLTQASVEATLALLGEGCTVPFIARYRKEATGSLDEEDILAVKTLSERLEALDTRRESIITSLSSKGALNSDLRDRCAPRQLLRSSRTSPAPPPEEKDEGLHRGGEGAGSARRQAVSAGREDPASWRRSSYRPSGAWTRPKRRSRGRWT